MAVNQQTARDLCVCGHLDYQHDRDGCWDRLSDWRLECDCHEFRPVVPPDSRIIELADLQQLRRFAIPQIQKWFDGDPDFLVRINALIEGGS